MRQGQMIIEVLVAIAILTIATVAATLVVLGSEKMSLDSRRAAEALSRAREALETAQALARNSYASVADSSLSEGGYTTQVDVVDVSSVRKDVIARVSWQAEPNRTQTVEIATTVTDAEGVQNLGGDTGGTGLSGDWRNPRTLGSVDLGPGNQATGLDVVNKLVYLSASASSGSKPDFFVVDATDGMNPVIRANIDTGPSLNAVDAADNFAYTANASTSAQLQIIDISNPFTPSLIRSFTLPGVSGSGAVGKSVFYYADRIYIGTNKASGPEFHIVDVSNPSSPVSLGSREINYDVNRIQINGDLAYITTSDANGEIKILNISNPGSIAEIGSFNPAGSMAGKGLYVIGNNLYLGRARGSGAGQNEFHIVNVASSSLPVGLGSVDLGSDLNGILVRENLAFLGTDDSNSEFQVWDVSSSTLPVFWSQFNFPQVVTGLDYEDNLVYVSVRSNDALRIITSQ